MAAALLIRECPAAEAPGRPADRVGRRPPRIAAWAIMAARLGLAAIARTPREALAGGSLVPGSAIGPAPSGLVVEAPAAVGPGGEAPRP